VKLRAVTLVLYAGGLVIGLVLVAIFGAVQVSSTPTFCGSCHIMEPYYESWVDSGHNEIACVDCHIPPGVTAELEKKYQAIAMVARYFTGTYGTRPWAEVEDSACLSCHERRLLVGKEVFGDILFDHRPHLTELRRGKKLRCTSCHSQIVQGSHIEVTASSCILCHFKDQPPGTGTARCESCHQTPEKIVRGGNVEFDHGEVKRFGMQCESCHAAADMNQGGVPKERCVTCHSDPEKLAAYDESDRLHTTHVSDHKVECTHCHLEIQHVIPPHQAKTAASCDSCHRKGHSFQLELYSGTGGRGVEPMPDTMYQLGIRCEGCHTGGLYGESARADEVACMSCHGPRYRKIFSLWQETLTRRTGQIGNELTRTARQLGASPPAVFADAQANHELVDRGRGIHNFSYSLEVLAQAHRQINEARQQKQLPELPLPWPEAPFASPCLDCHEGIEEHTGNQFGREFPHRHHVVRSGLECGTCHSSHEERVAQNLDWLKIGAEDCSSCHHGDSAAECSSCHAAIKQRTFVTEIGDFDHSLHVDDMELSCSQCHSDGASPAELSACEECH